MRSGHSLGAALSLLFAAELHSRHSELAERVAGVYAYASPRVGNAAFAAAFNKAFCNPDRSAASLLRCMRQGRHTCQADLDRPGPGYCKTQLQP